MSSMLIAVWPAPENRLPFYRRFTAVNWRKLYISMYQGVLFEQMNEQITEGSARCTISRWVAWGYSVKRRWTGRCFTGVKYLFVCTSLHEAVRCVDLSCQWIFIQVLRTIYLLVDWRLIACLFVCLLAALVAQQQWRCNWVQNILASAPHPRVAQHLHARMITYGMMKSYLLRRLPIDTH